MGNGRRERCPVASKLTARKRRSVPQSLGLNLALIRNVTNVRS